MNKQIFPLLKLGTLGERRMFLSHQKARRGLAFFNSPPWRSGEDSVGVTGSLSWNPFWVDQILQMYGNFEGFCYSSALSGFSNWLVSWFITYVWDEINLLIKGL